MFKKTLVLFLISLIGSQLCFLTERLGYGEAYPFFSWKLYSQPPGNKGMAKEYRIYAKSATNDAYVRLPIESTSTFSESEYCYTFNFLVDKTITAENDSLGKVWKYKLLKFITHIHPNRQGYKVVEETYIPDSLIYNSSNYDTATVITF
ncbi:MAG TPA: hypothetical protein VF691_07215 [Cytophagaceae bacterium]|jgi:hypothetical protein